MQKRDVRHHNLLTKGPSTVHDFMNRRWSRKQRASSVGSAVLQCGGYFFTPGKAGELKLSFSSKCHGAREQWTVLTITNTLILEECQPVLSGKDCSLTRLYFRCVFRKPEKLRVASVFLYSHRKVRQTVKNAQVYGESYSVHRERTWF